jgi:hypothetical protein
MTKLGKKRKGQRKKIDFFDKTVFHQVDNKTVF